MAGLAVVGFGIWFSLRDSAAIRVGTGVVSHALCSAAFISHVDPDQFYADAILSNPGPAGLAKRLRYSVDRTRQEVTVTWAGHFESRTIYRPDLGCVIERGGLSNLAPTEPTDGRSIAAGVLSYTNSLPSAPPSAAIETALDRAFVEPERPPYRRVKAIVILHSGEILGERYAAGYTAETPLMGYSVSKSVTNALLGILVRQGKLWVAQQAPVAEWSSPSDPRHAITIDELLRMTTGLSIAESDTGFDPVSRMLFLERDMAGFAARSRLKAAPGTQWEYTSGNTLILSRIIRDALGGTAGDVLSFAQRELFGPLGMSSVRIDFDATGTPVGSIYMYATARDWARFGALYLNDGVAAGRRILPPGWVDYSAASTLGTDYGAGFWTNRGGHGNARYRIAGGMPGDSFYASGNFGQRILIVPSEQLVIVRLGFSNGPELDMKGLVRLTADISPLLK
jgi:CubicO group peptidase (beta-lactamase class C family)